MMLGKDLRRRKDRRLSGGNKILHKYLVMDLDNKDHRDR